MSHLDPLDYIFMAVTGLGFVSSLTVNILLLSPFLQRKWVNFVTQRNAQRIAKAEKKAADAAEKASRLRRENQHISVANSNFL